MNILYYYPYHWEIQLKFTQTPVITETNTPINLHSIPDKRNTQHIPVKEKEESAFYTGTLSTYLL